MGLVPYFSPCKALYEMGPMALAWVPTVLASDRTRPAAGGSHRRGAWGPLAKLKGASCHQTPPQPKQPELPNPICLLEGFCGALITHLAVKVPCSAVSQLLLQLLKVNHKKPWLPRSSCPRPHPCGFLPV